MEQHEDVLRTFYKDEVHVLICALGCFLTCRSAWYDVQDEMTKTLASYKRLQRLAVDVDTTQCHQDLFLELRTQIVLHPLSHLDRLTHEHLTHALERLHSAFDDDCLRSEELQILLHAASEDLHGDGARNLVQYIKAHNMDLFITNIQTIAQGLRGESSIQRDRERETPVVSASSLMDAVGRDTVRQWVQTGPSQKRTPGSGRRATRHPKRRISAQREVLFETEKDVEEQRVHDRRRRMPWTEQEETYLIQGVQKHGCGFWTDILIDFQGCFSPCRTAVDLKDKYRNMKKAGKIR